MILSTRKNSHKVVFVLSLLVAVLLFVVSITGLNSDLYEKEAPGWRLQCLGQDLVDLCIVLPALIISSILLLRGNIEGLLLWPGIISYIAYTFVIYCFDVHFNRLFIEYCAILGLSLYGLTYFLYSGSYIVKTGCSGGGPLIKTIASYFLALGSLFYISWLSDIIPAIRSGRLPGKLEQAQLFTNPVQVLDIAILLPMFLIAAFLLFRKKPPGLYAASCLLTFSVLMNLTILVLNMLEEDNPAMRLVFGTLSLFSFVLLFSLIRFYKRESQQTTA